MKKRLSSWKSKNLSFAGRLTLINSVLNSIPIYSMNTVKLPVTVCKEIDKINRDFLWASEEGKKAIHLIKWDTVCNKKEEGGLGIKKAEIMNQALLSKLGWRANHENGLWARVLKGKYQGDNFKLTTKIKNPSNSSSTWKGINHGLKIVEKGTTMRVGNGKNTAFWYEDWISSGPLLEFMPNPSCSEQKVADYLDDNGWNVDLLKDVLPLNKVNEICSRFIKKNSDVEDKEIWKFSSNGRFTVRSTYDYIQKGSGVHNWKWNFIWKIKVPPRTKTFLWTLCHGKLLTNDNRHARHMSDTANCNVCDFYREDIEHIFRDCKIAANLWNNTPNKPIGFNESNQSTFRWIMQNLKSKHLGYRGIPWPEFFSISLWFIWKWRCSTIFNPSWQCPPSPAEIIKSYVRNLISARSSELHIAENSHLLSNGWKPPPQDFYKLNTDGSRSSLGGIAAGGVIRDANGDWIRGFTHNIGIGTVLEAELWAIFNGISMARQIGISKLLIESDSSDAVNLVVGLQQPNHPSATLLNDIRMFLGGFNQWSISSISRNANSTADLLAKNGLSLDLGLHHLFEAPSFLSAELAKDFLSASCIGPPGP